MTLPAAIYQHRRTWRATAKVLSGMVITCHQISGHGGSQRRMTVYTSSTSRSGNTAPAGKETGTKGRRKPGRFGKSPRWMKILIVLGSVLLVGSACTGAVAWTLVNRYEKRVTHEDLLGDAALPKDEKRWQSGPLNLLLLGSDSREGETDKGQVAGERSDTIMLLHIAAARDSAAIISIPRDSYVDIPAGGNWHGGKNKLNAAFAFGGAPLAAKAITQLTGVPLDGAMIANFAGVRKMVDTVGGVRVCADYDVKSSSSQRIWKKGCHQMDGATAEEFMRERKNVPGGDIGRMHQQQLVVQGVIEKISANNVFANPLALDKVLTTAAGSLTVDKNLDLRQLAMTVKNIKPANVKFATVPYSNLDLKTSAGSSVELDQKKAASMFEGLRADSVNQWLAANSSQASGG
jgi:LCP family protein required for cell wall assembly